jgi:hypothetical protein
MNAQRVIASLSYFVPCFATWSVDDPATALGIGLAAPVVLALLTLRFRSPRVAFHAFQSLHTLLFFAWIAAFAGIIEKPGGVRWAGALGSIPLDTGASVAARAAFWAIAIVRGGLLFILGVRTFAGLETRIPLLGDVPPFFARRRSAES